MVFRKKVCILALDPTSIASISDRGVWYETYSEPNLYANIRHKNGDWWLHIIDRGILQKVLLIIPELKKKMRDGSYREYFLVFFLKCASCFEINYSCTERNLSNTTSSTSFYRPTSTPFHPNPLHTDSQTHTQGWYFSSSPLRVSLFEFPNFRATSCGQLDDFYHIEFSDGESLVDLDRIEFFDGLKLGELYRTEFPSCE